MSDFGFDITHLNDSASLTNQISESYNPDGAASLKTTASVDRYANQTLTSRNLTDIMSGGALNRNPAAVADATSKFIKSSLDGILAVGYQAGDSFQIPNPDYQGNDGESQTLTGHDAYLKAVSSSIMGTGFAPTGSVSPLSDSINGKWPPNGAESKVGDSNGTTWSHNNIIYTIDPTAPSLGERAVAAVSELSDEERQMYIDRGTLLKASLNEPALVLGFQFDIPDTLSTYAFNQTSSYFSSTDGVSQDVSSETISAPSTLAYISAALIECLLMLVDPTKGVDINGSFGLSRISLSENDKSDQNLSPEKYLDKKNKNSISDHAFGRAFDISKVGNVNNIGKSKATYSAALLTFLDKLSTLPTPLLPDLIIISPDVAKDLGVMQGYDTASTAIRQKYPILKFVNFEAGTEHTNNIHISFSPQRAGQYMGTTGWTTSSTNAGNAGSSGSGSPDGGNADTAKEKAFTNYKNGGGDLTVNELYAMLRDPDYGPLSDEAAAIMCAVAAREGGGLKPSSWNGVDDDYSFGLFQYNLKSQIPTTGSNGEKNKVLIYYDGTTVNPQSIYASSLAYVSADSASWDPQAVLKKINELKQEGKTFTDDKIWYPVNQVYSLYTKMGRTPGKKIDDSAIFYPWGDYPNKNKTPRSDCGFIFNTKFQNAVNAYLTTGKTYETLVAWVRKNLPTKNPGTKNYIEGWVSGDVYYDHPRAGTGENGSLKNETASTPIITTGSVAIVSAQSGGSAEPPFTKADIRACADWLKANRLPSYITYWTSKNTAQLQGDDAGGWGIGCEKFARILSAALGLFADAKTDLVNKAWEELDPNDGGLVTATGLQASGGSAEDHLNRIKGNSTFHAAGDDIGDNPPVGSIVFWRQIEGTPYGHNGISIGGKLYVDQHTVEPRSIADLTWPGKKTQYAGWSSAW